MPNYHAHVIDADHVVTFDSEFYATNATDALRRLGELVPKGGASPALYTLTNAHRLNGGFTQTGTGIRTQTGWQFRKDASQKTKQQRTPTDEERRWIHKHRSRHLGPSA